MADNVIRQSQLITTCGPGAMIDLPDCSVIVSGLQNWSHLRQEKVDEPRLAAKLRRLLDLSSLELRTPPRHEENARQVAPVGACIFPTWFIVKDARPSPRDPQWRRRRLVRWDHLEGRKEGHKRLFRDDEDGKRKPVVPVRFVCGCRRGHIDDLDWRRFVHQSGKTCGRPLWLEERGTGADISDTFGVCDCGEERSLYEASGPGMGALGHCEGRRPWIGQFAREACGEPYRLLVRTASNAYFPQTMSVISLPEFDAGLAAKVSAHHDRLKAADDLGALESFRRIPELDAAFADTADETVLAEYRRQQGGGEREDVPVKTAEFEILDKGDDVIGEDDPRSRFYAETLARAAWDPDEGPEQDPEEDPDQGPDQDPDQNPEEDPDQGPDQSPDEDPDQGPDQSPDEDPNQGPDQNSDQDPLLAAVDKLVLVHRLREVVSLLGFTRFEAISPDKDGELDLDVIRASLAETITWLPAVENRGEGVFVSFRSRDVESWLARPGVRGRGRRLQEGWRAWAAERHRPEDGFPGLAYVMLHSLSHMLMTSIALDCGYPASSLRERVYAGAGGEGGSGGYGILIYTGSSDAEGTLGGLVEAGRRFGAHLRRAVDDGRLCSNDPVCAEHAPDSRLEGRPLQGAACHGCLLIAETSCEQRNDFLDRALVVPTVGVEDAAFFDLSRRGP